jgi:hypothetical protein
MKIPLEDHPLVQGLLADHKCISCNPPGWQEVDGVQLPIITWADTSDRISPERLREFEQEIASILAPTNMDGVTVLSDTRAPAQFVGRR